MPNPFFQFKQFTVYHDRCAMKVTTDACLFGAWVAREILRLPTAPVQLLDVGTGTGLLSLMVAQQVKGRIDALEIDPAAAAQAAENVDASPWKNRIDVLHQDVLTWQPPTRYDCIFSNPPFYEKELRSGKNNRNLAHHDEGLKLSGLLHFIQQNLAEEGDFFLLLSAKRERELARLLGETGLTWQQKVLVQPTPKHPPFRLLIQGCRQTARVGEVKTTCIRNETGDYTPDFTRLLQDYYLYLSMAS